MADWRSWQHILVYGGTFDPPHRAHVIQPRRVAERLGADGVLYIPAGRPPHKPDEQRTAGEHRAAMLRAALADEPWAAVWAVELKRGGPSYTVDTLDRLRDIVGPEAMLRLLIGMDMALIFDQWRSPDRIEALAEPVVMIRPPHDAASFLAELPAARRDQWCKRLVEVPAMDLSSSGVRRGLAERGPDDPQVAAALPPAVLAYIREHGLYRNQ